MKYNKTKHSSTIIKVIVVLFLIQSFIFVNGYNPPFSNETEVNLKVDYSLDFASQSNNEMVFKVWMARVIDHTTDDSLSSPFVYQDVENQVITTGTNLDFNDTIRDSYQNFYDYFQVNISSENPNFTVTYSQNIELKAHSWEIPDNITLESYDISSSFYKKYTSALPYTEVNDSNIKSIADEILESSTNVVEIAENAYLKVVDLLDYQLVEGAAKGALQALLDGNGDCSEYSSLLVAILRSAGIPARKVLGYALVDGDISASNPKYNMQVDDQFHYSIKESNIPAHAWVQFYIPNLGWISVDPTWGESTRSTNSLFYFNNYDYIRIISTVGDYYNNSEFNPPLEFADDSAEGIAEFPYIYFVLESDRYINPSLIDYDFNIDISVLEVNNPSTSTIDPFTLLLFIGSGSFLTLCMVIGLFSSRKKRNRNKMKYYR